MDEGEYEPDVPKLPGDADDATPEEHSHAASHQSHDRVSRVTTRRSKAMDDQPTQATSRTSASSKSGAGMKGRTVGVLGVGAVILGMYLANLWKGPGIGGPGNDKGNPQAPSDQTPADQSPISTSVKPSSGTTPADPNSGTKEQQNITVVLHKNQYRLSTFEKPEVGLDVALETIVSRAAKMEGDDKGVKVYILLEKSAQEGTRSDLLAALQAGGVKKGEILEISGFVD